MDDPRPAQSEVRPDPLRQAVLAKDEGHLTLELEDVLPAPFQLEDIHTHTSQSERKNAERVTIEAEPILANDPAASDLHAQPKPRPRRMSALGKTRSKNEAKAQVLRSRVTAIFDECMQIANYRLVTTRLQAQFQLLGCSRELRQVIMHELQQS